MATELLLGFRRQKLNQLNFQMICGPEVYAAQHVDQTTLSVGDPHRMCCIVSSYPKPELWWEHDQQNITWVGFFTAYSLRKCDCKWAALRNPRFSRDFTEI